MTFNTTSKEAWLSKTKADLKGKLLSELDFVITQDISQPALSHQDDLNENTYFPLIGEKTDNQWKIGELIHLHEGEKKANELAIAALEGGATALAFHYQEKPNLSQLLHDINLEWISTYFHGKHDLVKEFIEIAKNEKQHDLAVVNCGFYNIPVSEINRYHNQLPLGKFHIIESAAHEDVAEEIAHIALAYTAIIEQVEIAETNVLDALSISIRLTDLFMVNIAKIRALKIILSQIKDAYQLQVETPQIKASSAQSTLGDDADYNKIKLMPHALSGLIGGVDELFLPSSDTALEQNHFSHRISRNISHLLQLESFMERVIDPAAGSYYIETLTDKIAAQSWSIFQQKHKQAG